MSEHRWTVIVLGQGGARHFRFGAPTIATLAALLLSGPAVGFAVGALLAPPATRPPLAQAAVPTPVIPPIGTARVPPLEPATHEVPIPAPDERPPPDRRVGQRCSGVRTPDDPPFARRVALTFDDGPTRHTPHIAEVLRAHGAPATFFVSAESLATERAIERARALADDPLFSIGNHGALHHDYSEVELTQVTEELADARGAYLEVGLDTTFFRFPYGRASCGAAARVRNAGYRVVGWDVDSADWCFDRGGGRCRQTDRFGPDIARRTMTEHVVEQVRQHRGGIVLFHDNVALTRRRLDAVLDALEDDGVRFVKLSDEGAFPELNERIPELRARRLRLGDARAARRLLHGDVRRDQRIAAGEGAPPRTLLWPVENAVVARGFGSGADGYHLAVDIAGVRGSDVHAIAEGIVGYAGDAVEGYGNVVILIHPGGLVSFYAHNDDNRVRAGERVERGQTIATVGATGLARGPHVHFELAFAGQSCDPAPLFRPLPEERAGPIEGLVAVEWTSPTEAPVACEERRDFPASARSHAELHREPAPRPRPAAAARQEARMPEATTESSADDAPSLEAEADVAVPAGEPSAEPPRTEAAIVD